MAAFTPVAIRCMISRGGFSGERVVTVRCVDGSEKKGLAPTHYCWNKAKKPLGEDEPTGDNPMEGFVAARRLRPNAQIPAGAAMVDIPDGEVMLVPEDSVIQRPESPEPEPSSHVSV